MEDPEAGVVGFTTRSREVPETTFVIEADINNTNKFFQSI
jgi:hypothetical protein